MTRHLTLRSEVHEPRRHHAARWSRALSTPASLVLVVGVAAACATATPAPSAQGLSDPGKAAGETTASTTAPLACTARGERAASVYAALLAPYRPQLLHATTAYVVDAVIDGPPPAQRPGAKFPTDVADCLTRGLQGFPRVVLVSSRSDPRIPVVSSGGPVPVVKDGFIAVFGSVPPDGGKTQVSIDTGGGFGGRGGEYCIISSSGTGVQVAPCGAQWIS